MVVTIEAGVCMLFVVLAVIVTWLLGDSTFFPNGLAYFTSPFVYYYVSPAAINDHSLVTSCSLCGFQWKLPTMFFRFLAKVQIGKRSRADIIHVQ